MNQIFFVAFFCVVAAPLVAATIGVDFSAQGGEGMSLSTFQCFKNSGYDFAVIQTWQGGYTWNTQIANNAADAWTAGLAHVDVYIFFCPRCFDNSDPAGVVSTVVNGLAAKGVKYGMLWFDIEQCGGCWNDAGSNAQYIATGVNQAIAMGVHVGVYSSEYEWSQTVGGFTGFSQLPQWYADWDGVESFSDNTHNFGGWTSPSMKQFTDHGACADVDQSWYPDSWFQTYLNITQSDQPQQMIDMTALKAYYNMTS